MSNKLKQRKSVLYKRLNIFYFIFLLSPSALFGDTVNSSRSFKDGGTFFPNQELIYKDCKFECKAGLFYNLKPCECKDCTYYDKSKCKCPNMKYKDAHFYFTAVDKNLEINKESNKKSTRLSLLLQKFYTPGEKEMRVKGKVIHIKDYTEEIVTDYKGKQYKLRVTATATYDPDNDGNNTIKYRIKELKK